MSTQIHREIHIPEEHTAETLIVSLVRQLAKLNKAIKNEESCPGFMQRTERRKQVQETDMLLYNVGYYKTDRHEK